MSDVLDRFSPATREWFQGAFDAPTRAQAGAWDAISRGSHALVVAPTGSGKTLSAFLWSIDRLIASGASAAAASTAATEPVAAKRGKRSAAEAPEAVPGTRVLYISPLKALGVDVERNLRSPLVGVTQTAKRLGLDVPQVRVGVRSGDTPQAERRALLKNPPDILITTPESLFLLLTSAARETLRDVDTVIVDEVHALAGGKRGAHLAVSLERLDDLLEKPAQRIGLSATVRPHEEVARFLCGRAPVEIVAPTADKRFDLTVVVPVDDMTDPGAVDPARSSDAAGGPREGATAGNVVPDGERTGSIWPHVEEAIVDRILEHRSTIVFANSRRLAERLTARFNEIWEERNAPETEEGDDASTGGTSARRAPAALMGGSGQTKGSRAGTALLEPGVATEATGAPLARAHHGSVSKEQRAEIEDALKTGRLRCVVATSSLELGIDMGDVDLVVQVETPPSVASGLQRVGRAGHQVGEISRGVLFPKHRSDLVSTAVATERMVTGQIERLSVPANPLDVLAQQTVAVCALEPVEVEAWFDTVRRSAPFRSLPRSAFEASLDLLAGRYPSDDFAELRPRLVWDRDAGTLTGRPGAQRLAVTSGGTIPDRGMFAVHMVGGDAKGGTRVGELDEEMVYESRVGDVFALGATSWTIQEITHDRVLVTPAFGQPGRLPFWKGDGLGRPAELGEAIGAFVRETDAATPTAAEERLSAAGLDHRAVGNLLTYLSEQKRATGHLPTDRTLVVERSRDELGDWRVILHSPYGMHVHAPWALAVAARVRERLGVDGGATASDDGIIVRIPDTDAEPPGADLFVIDPDELEAMVRDEVGGSALFASRFRECAARALLLPNRRPGSRAPLWQQRQRSAQLLDVAKRYPDFPILLETVRECLQDVYDLPALLDLAKRIGSRAVRVVETTTDTPSPFAASLLFGYVGAFMYEGDSPLAERRAAALALDQGMLSELLGHVELRELLDPGVITRTELELQRLLPERRMRGLEGVADLVRMLGPLTVDEVAARLEAENAAESPGATGTAGEPSAAITTAATTSAASEFANTADRPHDDDVPEPEPDVPHATAEQALAHLRALESAKRVIRSSFAGAEWWSAIEDSSRLRDALGVPLPIGVPVAFIEPVTDPLGDLVARYARTHGPFTTSAVARRFGLGPAVARHTLGRLADERRILSGEFLTAARERGADDDEWCDSEVLRRLRLRSLAALRHEVEPVDQQTFARFLPVWQHVGGSLRGVDGVLTVVEQLAGVPIPASAWESLVLPQRVRDYSPAMLDELTATGEVSWSGAGSLPGNDGWVALHPADAAPVTLPTARDHEPDALQREVLLALGTGGAYFFNQLAESTGAADDKALVAAIWDLVWAGLITNDTFSPLRTLIGGGGSHRATRATPRARTYRGRAVPRPTMATRVGGPRLGGRWSILPLAEGDATIRAAATAEILLDRYGIVTRGSVATEGVPGGFALAYKVLSGFEEKGRARRGYIIDGLGAAQFSTSGTVDRVRTFVRSEPRGEKPGERLTSVTLAATDPANPYGAALPWPSNETTGTKHRPGRKAGGLVTIVDGELVFYLERGGSSLLVFTTDDQLVRDAAVSLANVVRDGRVEKLAVENVNGEFALGSPLSLPLREAGFAETPRGLRIRRA
ncbi:DEAD/DEAH box helicase [Labedella phragmitis]|uniref:DEAD/DEAH box helicase n=1 Tax=Labedella phragmitis TaxID=2498849 RepID=A0A3S5CE18_9MICO|nr:DEAD/DEAH box helicase [Labedella phragmitis]RWZ50056.1 DEAD/DEAH box helicase [Labedella phragmitis]